jgi:hypothetical protein
MGPLESFLHDPVTADDEFCSFVEALACPDNVRSVSEVWESAAPVAQLTAPKRAFCEETGPRHSYVLRTSRSTQQGGVSTQQTIEGDINGESMKTAASPQQDPYLNRLEKARERNRRNQRACRERVRVRCCLLP